VKCVTSSKILIISLFVCFSKTSLYYYYFYDHSIANCQYSDKTKNIILS